MNSSKKQIHLISVALLYLWGGVMLYFYTSGRIGSRFWNGPFDKIQEMLGIQSGELNGYWLREKL